MLRLNPRFRAPHFNRFLTIDSNYPLSGKVCFVAWHSQYTTSKTDIANFDWKQDCANDSKLA
jgi:hypothetical protein